MEKAEAAKELFLLGNNCAQSVLLSFAQDLHVSKDLAEKMAAGFGGGMGKVQHTCGAVTGAIMVLGMMHGEKAGSNEELKNRSYQSVKELIREFTDSFGSTQCRDLIGCDLNTPEGAARFREEKMMENICAGCVARAVRIVESLSITA